MNELTDAQVIEAFHLMFLRVLSTKRQDWFVLKGGANIRYFFGSDRYSNDIDLDLTGTDSWRVEDQVDSALGSSPMANMSRQAGIQIVETTKPKQTETTRRWKLGLVSSGQRDPVRTKIEFSDRYQGSGGDVVLEVVPEHIVKPYGQMSPTVQHYTESAAIEQKIAALALRSETKARDVFDLELLLRRRRRAGTDSRPLATEHVRHAAERALEIPYESFAAEVIPFLDPEIALTYDSSENWEQMRTSVASWLDEIAKETRGEVAR